jgi:hypothetical protein
MEKVKKVRDDGKKTPDTFGQRRYWDFVAMYYFAWGALFLLNSQSGFVLRHDHALLQAVSSSSIDIAALLIAILSVFMTFRRNTVNTIWFRLALFFDATVFLSAAGKGYFAYMTNQVGADFQTNWEIILFWVIVVILLCLSMARRDARLELAIFGTEINLHSVIIAIPYLALLAILFYSEPMVIGTYFLGGLIGLLILMWMAIMVSGLRQQLIGNTTDEDDVNGRAEIMFMNRVVTGADVLDALEEFRNQYPRTNDYDDWLNKDSYKYALRLDGTMYPPKKILSLAARIPTSEFSGGEPTNRVFGELGFDIVNK